MIAVAYEAAGAAESGGAGSLRRAADLLCLLATPSLAVMALLSVGGGAPDMLCSAAHGASPLGGMLPMYVLMSAFHAGPWLRLLAGGRSGKGA